MMAQGILTHTRLIGALLLLAGPGVIRSAHGTPQDTERGALPLEQEGQDLSFTYTGRHALVIGINQYRDPAFPDLGYAVTDARGIADVLNKRLGFPEDRVRLIENEAATKAALEEALEEWLCNRDAIAADDLVVVFFAGHGLTRPSDGDKSRGYLVPVDGRQSSAGEPAWSSLVSIQRLEEVSEWIPAKHVLFILDCCFGGIAVERAVPGAPIVGGLSTPARDVITAGDATQTVQDGGGGGHSIFTGAILEAIGGAADDDGDGTVNSGELYSYVALRLEAETMGRQTPVQGTFPGHKGGRVALFPPEVRATGRTAAQRLKDLELDNEEFRREIERLADALTVRDLLQEDRTLWPRRAYVAPAMRSWLGRASEVLSHEPDHRNALARVREIARLRQTLDGTLDASHDSEPDWKRVDRLLQWQYEAFGRMIGQLDVIRIQVGDVSRRLQVAETIEERTVFDYEPEWQEAIDQIAAHEAYGGLELEPIVGLVPLGPDPQSGLWEFWHLESGQRPERNPTTDRWEIRDETGIVLVLLPGGTFRMGARVPTNRDAPEGPNLDPQAHIDESPVHDVTLAPFVMSKYEMTQGQWLRIAGTNPSGYGPGLGFGNKVTNLAHPVELVSWHECDEMSRRLGLLLPTEAQWEYAARAGTTSMWWTGIDKSWIQGAANLADRFARANRGDPTFHYDTDFDDGCTVHAHVGSYRPNAFGLHDTMGNVLEWCLDWYVAYHFKPAARTGERLVPEAFQHTKACRGGCFTMDTYFLRSAFRENQAPDIRGCYIGLRPALNLQPEG
ncbi:MAG: SUMF1/EgtB/PvdO family nonheme iron enzyme [Planctomycetota bacterium]